MIDKHELKAEITKFMGPARVTTKEIQEAMKKRFGKCPKSSLWYLLQEMRNDGDLKQVTDGKSSVWISLDF